MPRPNDKSSKQTTMRDFDGSGMEERVLAAISAATREMKDEMAALRAEIKDMKAEFEADMNRVVDRFTEEIEEMKKDHSREIGDLKRHIEKLEYHDRKYNLVFQGVKAERGGEEEAIKQICVDKLKLDEMPAIANCHMLGQNAIIARMATWEGKQEILKSAKRLKGTKLGIQTDLPKSMRDKRSALLRKCREIRESGKQARVIERGADVVLQVRESEKQQWVNS